MSDDTLSEIESAHQRPFQRWEPIQRNIYHARRDDSAAQGASREFYSDLREKAFRARKYARKYLDIRKRQHQCVDCGEHFARAVRHDRCPFCRSDGGAGE